NDSDPPLDFSTIRHIRAMRDQPKTRTVFLFHQRDSIGGIFERRFEQFRRLPAAKKEADFPTAAHIGSVIVHLSGRRHKAVHHLLGASLLKSDVELVAIDRRHLAVTEFLMKYAHAERNTVRRRQFMNRAGAAIDHP
ncbi:MAG: hypothetical protein ACI9MJ_001804, partial [Alphaproteobacteria bacterium]